MKYSILTKFIAIILCALCLVTCAAGVGGIILVENSGLYTNDLDSWIDTQLHSIGYGVAYDYCALYAAEHLGDCPADVMEVLQNDYYQLDSKTSWGIHLYQDGALITQSGSIPKNAREFSYRIIPNYPRVQTDASYSGDVLYSDIILVPDPASDSYIEVPLEFLRGPEYEAVLYLLPNAIETFQYTFVAVIYQMRYHFIAFVVVSLLGFAVALVYLCCAAGRRPHSEKVYPVALNRLPLDLYAAAAIAAEVGLSWLVLEMLEACFDYGGNWGVASLIILGIFVMSLIIVAFLFACAAQMKTPGGFWWRRTLLGFLVVRLWRCLKWTGRGIRAVFGMLPLVWQWLGAVILMLGAPAAFFLCAMASWHDFWTFIWALLFFCTLAGDLFLTGWWLWYMGQIVRGAAVMGQGNLEHQIPTRYMFGRFRDFANTLNSMADAARIAAQRQLKSERMKTELITNVSHDIKTPLTSIINYVDLLKKPHDEVQAQQYLEVLDRQSQRLKKLIGDLMDMSKASTGNLAVEILRINMTEAVNQALGEFSDKFTAAGLEPLFRCPQDPVMIQADGRHLWRVLSNLLGNAVKYAMPGTRLYLDLMTVQDNAILSIKNISRDQLNVAADELLERFVRGDASRNTEGSGLGLNIAKSLVELQKGQMHLMVDGDLFKVTIVLPLSNP